MPDQETPVSWDLFYLTKEGIEAHLQLKGATVVAVRSFLRHCQALGTVRVPALPDHVRGVRD